MDNTWRGEPVTGSDALELSPLLNVVTSNAGSMTRPEGAAAGAVRKQEYRLHDLVRLGDLESVRAELLSATAENVNMFNLSGWSPIHVAVMSGKEEMLRLLIAAGADVNKMTKTGSGALHLAARLGHQALARLLVESGADIEAADSSGKTAEHVARWWGFEGLSDHLRKLYYASKFRRPHRPALTDEETSDEDLLAKLPTGSMAHAMGDSESDTASDSEASSGDWDWDESGGEAGGGRRSLWARVRQMGPSDIVRLRQMESVNAATPSPPPELPPLLPPPRDDGMTARRGLVPRPPPPASGSTVSETKRGIVPRPPPPPSSELRQSSTGDDVGGGTSISARPSITSQDRRQQALPPSLQRFRVLISNKSGVFNPKDKDQLAVQLVDRHLSRGGHINDHNKIGLTFLHLASSEGLYRTAKYLLEKNADIDLTDKSTRTPLHTALNNDTYPKWEVAKLLIANGAEYKNHPNRVIDIAIRHDNMHFFDYLLDKEAPVGPFKLKTNFVKEKYRQLVDDRAVKNKRQEFQELFDAFEDVDQIGIVEYMCNHQNRVYQEKCHLLCQTIIANVERFEQESIVLRQAYELFKNNPELSQKDLNNDVDNLSAILEKYKEKQSRYKEIELEALLMMSMMDTQGQAIRLMKQRYGKDEDNLLAYLAATGKSLAISYLLTNETAKSLVSKHGMILAPNLNNQTFMELIQAQGPSMSRQKEECLDLVAEMIKDREEAVSTFKKHLLTSKEGKEALESLKTRYELTLVAKSKIIWYEVFVFLLTTVFFYFDFGSDIIVTIDSAMCIDQGHGSQPDQPAVYNVTESPPVPTNLNCSRLPSVDWTIITGLSILHILLPYLLYFVFYFYWQKHNKKNAAFPYKRFLILVVFAPMWSKFILMVTSIKDKLCRPGTRKNKLKLKVHFNCQVMAKIAVSEAALEANYQLYINFILFFPTILKIVIHIDDFLDDRSLSNLDFLLESRSVAIFTSFVALVWSNGVFQAYMKQGALDFALSPLARTCLIVTVAVEILGRLLLISVFCYFNPLGLSEHGRVHWSKSLVFFYCHVFICFLLNLVLNDLPFSTHYRYPTFYIEALVNAFSGFFTYSNYNLFDPDNQRKQHQPSFLRQLVFWLINFAEFVLLTGLSYYRTPEFIIDENGKEIPVNASRANAGLVSLILLQVGGLLLRLLYYRLHPWDVGFKPSAKITVLGQEYEFFGTSVKEVTYPQRKHTRAMTYPNSYLLDNI